MLGRNVGSSSVSGAGAGCDGALLAAAAMLVVVAEGGVDAASCCGPDSKLKILACKSLCVLCM